MGSDFEQTRIFIFLQDLLSSWHLCIDANPISSNNIALTQNLVLAVRKLPLVGMQMNNLVLIYHWIFLSDTGGSEAGEVRDV